FSLREAAPRANDPLERFLILGSLIEHWRRHYNIVRPHSAIGYKPPEPEAIIPVDQRSIIQKNSTAPRDRGSPGCSHLSRLNDRSG
ncbi:MAG: integrase core domain-containing protein, partial [Pseudomonadota bacterium]